MSSPTRAVAVPEAPAKAVPHAVNSARFLRVQRACSCGGDCASCNQKKPKELLQRKAVSGAPAPAPAPAPPAAPVHAPAAAPASSAAPAPAAKAPEAAKPAAKPPAARKAAELKGRDQPPTKEKAKSAAPAVTEKKKSAEGASDIPPIVRRVLDTPGEPLDFATQTSMEAQFGHSFREVRIHTDALAAESARAVYAHAYTVGEHIVFDSEQYQPQTTEGRHLLAHELAHTIQQHGLQKSGSPIGSDTSGDYQHLEREADTIAHSVMTRPTTPGAPVSTAGALAPRLSRAGKDKSQAPLKDAANKKDEKDPWVDVDENSELGKAGVAKIYRAPDATDLVAVSMRTPFEVPKEKGSEAVSLWNAQAKAGALQAIMSPGESQVKTTTGVKQARPNTDKLRDLWLLKLGWNDKSEDTLWKQAAAKAGFSAADSVFRPGTKAGNHTCDVDHILELQFGGNNIPANVQMLDSSPNRSSGSQISQFLRSTAFGIQQALAKDDSTGAPAQTKALAIRMQFSSAVASTESIDCACCKTEAEGKGLKLAADQKGSSPGTPYPMKSGAFTVCVIANKEEHLDLRDSSLPENKAASTLVPGLQLVQWTPPKGAAKMKTCADDAADAAAPPEAAAKSDNKAGAKGKAPAAKAPSHAGGTVKAELDPTSRILEKLKVNPGQGVELARDADGRLAAPVKDPRLAFAIDYLSKGVFHKLNIGADGSLSGSGSIFPSAPFLPKPFEVAFDKDRFAMTAQVKKPKLPIPGVEITEASIGLQIAPEFKPEGKVAFQLSAARKQVLHGQLTVSADDQGLVVDGDVFANLPGVEEAKGTLSLKDKKWSGGIDIKAGDFGKLKYIKSGEVAIRFSEEKGMSAAGQVELDVPGVSDPVKAQVFYNHSDGWSFRGKAVFHPPRIDPVEITLEYANGHLSGHGETGLTLPHMSGHIQVRYYDELFEGTGTLGVKTERVEGSIKVEMHHRPNRELYFTGEGQVSLKVTDSLVATAGIKIDEKEKVQFLGELAFTKPIELFKGFSGHYEIFSFEHDIPLPPPLSIGGIGLNVFIHASLSAEYGIGPVVLNNTKATANFQPLEKDPQLDLDLQSQLDIPAHGSVSGTISGGLKIQAYIASAEGGLDITATATLAGGLSIPLHAHYKDGKIEADIDFRTDPPFKLLLALALAAHVKARAGIGWLSVEAGKEWQLGRFDYDPGLTVGMALKNKIRYVTGEGLQLPGPDDITWTKPNIDGIDAVKKTAASSQAGEEHET